MPIVGWTAEQAFRPDQTPASWSGYTGGTYTSASTTYADPSHTGGWSFTETTNRNFGSVTNATNTVALTWTPPRPGRYWTCANSYMQILAASIYGSIRLTDGTTTIAEAGMRTTSAGGFAEGSVPLCGIYNATGAAVTFKVQTKTSNAANAVSIQPGPVRGAVEWSIVQLDSGSAAPILLGSVTTSGEAVYRIESLRMENANCTTSPCALADKTPGITSVTRGGTAGEYTINFTAGTWAATPACTVTAINRQGGDYCNFNTAGTTSSIAVQCYRGTNAVIDTGFYAMCHGKR